MSEEKDNTKSTTKPYQEHVVMCIKPGDDNLEHSGRVRQYLQEVFGEYPLTIYYNLDNEEYNLPIVRCDCKSCTSNRKQFVDFFIGLKEDSYKRFKKKHAALIIDAGHYVLLLRNDDVSDNLWWNVKLHYSNCIYSERTFGVDAKDIMNSGYKRYYVKRSDFRF